MRVVDINVTNVTGNSPKLVIQNGLPMKVCNINVTNVIRNSSIPLIFKNTNRLPMKRILTPAGYEGNY